MAKFEMLIDPDPEDPKPDPNADILRSLAESQAATAEALRRMNTPKEEEDEPISPQQFYAPNAPEFDPDEAIADPVGAMSKMAEYTRQRTIAEVGQSLSPVLNQMVDGQYDTYKQRLAESPYFKYAEKALDKHFKGHPERHNPKAIQEKFYALVGQNVGEWQGQLEREAPPPPTRRSEPADHDIPTRGAVPERPEPGAKVSLAEAEAQVLDEWNRMYPELNMSAKEYKAIRDGDMLPGERAVGRR